MSKPGPDGLPVLGDASPGVRPYTVVYKTHGKDLPWLGLSLMSLCRFLRDRPAEVHVHHHDACTERLHALLDRLNTSLTLRTFPVAYDYHGYLKQQVVKLDCHARVGTDWVMLLDSDTLFHGPLGLRDLLAEDGRFRWRVADRSAANEHNERWQVWGDVVLRLTGEPMRRYYGANGFPFLFRRETLRAAARHFERVHGLGYDAHCLDWARRHGATREHLEAGGRVGFAALSKAFSEFSWIGWYAERHSDDYLFEPMPEMNATLTEVSPWASSFWSHAGLDPTLQGQVSDLIRRGEGERLRRCVQDYNARAAATQGAPASRRPQPFAARLVLSRRALGYLTRRALGLVRTLSGNRHRA